MTQCLITWHNVLARDSRLRLTHLNYSLYTARCFHSVLSRAANCTSASWLTQFNKTSYRPISDENGVTWSATSQWEVEERVRRQKCSNEAEKTSWTSGDWLSVITWLECSSLIGWWRVCLLFNEGSVGEECWKEAVWEGTWLLHYRRSCWAAATMTRDLHVILQSGQVMYQCQTSFF